MTTPDPGRTYTWFRAVTAIGPDDVWAVGGWASGKGDAGTLVMHWDGTTWAIVPSPDVPPRPQVGWSYPGLESVFALSSADVWAAGTSENVAPAGPSNTLVLHWDGEAWTAVPSPDLPGEAGSPYDALSSMHGASGNDVWAVGSFGLDLGGDRPWGLPEHTMALHWDGAAWAVVPTPVIQRRNALSGVVALSSTDVWAVGSAQDDSPSRALVEQ